MKKDKYNIQYNQSSPSTEDIKKHQDFDALMDKYQQGQAGGNGNEKPKRKIGRFIKRALIAAAAAIGLLVIGISLKGKKNKALVDNAPYVNPPMAESVPEEIYTATVKEANQGGRIVFKSGTIATVPPRAFANRAGEVISGPVEVKIKEYHDYVDFFLSGIPMEYDSLGVMYQLESAGMIEIYAEQDGRRLDIMPEKAIDIELKSKIMVKPGSKEPKFNIYKLDQEEENWKYITRNQMVFIDDEPEIESAKMTTTETVEAERKDKIKAINKEIDNQLRAFEKTLPQITAPKKPAKADTNNPTFDLKVDKLVVQNNISEEQATIQNDESALRDLRNRYAKSIWEVLPGQATWSPAIANTNWDDYDIRMDADKQFTVTFIKGSSKVDVKVKPVLVGKDYNEALEEFNQKFAAYNQEIATRQASIDAKKVELEKIKAARLATANLEFDNKVAKLRDMGRDDMATVELVKREVLNKFTVSSFGIWNCDRPLPPYAGNLKGKFMDQHDTEYNGPTAFIVDKNRNSVAKFNAAEGINVQFNMNSENLMWLVTKENKLAVYRPEDFKKIDHARGKHTFVMNLEDQEIDSEEDIREILNFD